MFVWTSICAFILDISIYIQSDVSTHTTLEDWSACGILVHTLLHFRSMLLSGFILTECTIILEEEGPSIWWDLYLVGIFIFLTSNVLDSWSRYCDSWTITQHMHLSFSHRLMPCTKLRTVFTCQWWSWPCGFTCRDSFHVRNVALLWALPTPQIILTVGRDRALPHPVSKCKSWTLSFQVQYELGCKTHKMSKWSCMPYWLCWKSNLDWCLYSKQPVQSHCGMSHFGVYSKLQAFPYTTYINISLLRRVFR